MQVLYAARNAARIPTAFASAGTRMREYGSRVILALECVAIESRPAVRPRASPHAAARFKPTGREATGSPEPHERLRFTDEPYHLSAA
jgi:hypothetical protein